MISSSTKMRPEQAEKRKRTKPKSRGIYKHKENIISSTIK
jgi:hypothetical protein